VADRLGGLLSTDVAGKQPDRARLWEQDGELIVLLERFDGGLIGIRRFPRTFECKDLANAAAVSLADWESDVHPEFPPRLVARATPILLQAPAQLALPLPLRRWQLNAGVALAVGGSVGGSPDRPVPAGGAVVGAWLTRAGWQQISFRAEFEGQSEREISFSYGGAAWRRWALGLGVERSFFPGPADGGGWFRWFALARLAWLDMRGQGFTLNRRDSTIDPGAVVGVRAIATRGRWSSWVELAACSWPVRQAVQANGVGTIGHLPALEAFVRVGLGLTPVR
jgi:hypothetical protein